MFCHDFFDTMLDTVNFMLTQNEAESVDFLSEVTPYLSSKTYTEYTNGNNCVTGYIGNLQVSVSSNYVKIKKGSLCKWMMGDNYQTMSRADIKQAIEKLSDTLHLPMDRAKITRIDMGMAFSMNEPVENYFSHLGLLTYADRSPQPNGIYYYRKGQAEVLCFYNKNKEQKKHREAVPEIYKNLNMLRYELRLKKGLPSLLRVPQVTAALLYNEIFCFSLLKRWQDTYNEIRKINDIDPNLSKMTASNLRKMGYLYMIDKVGGELNLVTKITEAYKRGDLSRQQSSNHKQAIKDACKIRDGLIIQNKMIQELDIKIAEAVKYYRDSLM
jgi:hypothetical protein